MVTHDGQRRPDAVLFVRRAVVDIILALVRPVVKVVEGGPHPALAVVKCVVSGIVYCLGIPLLVGFAHKVARL
jgi:hypothetical protein